MKLKHEDHYENILLYGECECTPKGFTIHELVQSLEKEKQRKLLQEYPDLKVCTPVSELEASIPF